jgi:iron complex transport system ATP-binding protein
MNAIAVHDLEVDLDRTPILREVTCAIGSGGWLALLGPNGSGKTTLLRAIAGLIPYRGTVRLDGPAADAGSLRTLRPRERARLIAYVPQTPTLPPDMKVTDYVLLGRTPHLSYLAGPGRADREAARRAAGLLDVTRFGERRLDTLSGGERQRVVLARALAQEPKIMLLDEPTSALDIGHQQNVLDLIDTLRRSSGVTVVTTLHDLTTAGQYAHELVLLKQGRVEAAGVPTAVLTEDRIAEVYAARVTVSTDAAGDTVVNPIRAAPPRTDPRQQYHPC